MGFASGVCEFDAVVSQAPQFPSRSAKERTLRDLAFSTRVAVRA